MSLTTKPLISIADQGLKVTDIEASTQPTKVVMKHVKCVLLEKDNYYSQEAQFSMMLRGFQLMHYVEGDDDLLSPDFIQQDQLIFVGF